MIKPVLHKDGNEGKLYVVAAISNPRRYASRYRLYSEFEKHMRDSGAQLLTVEVALRNRQHEVTKSDDRWHVQLRSDHEYWVKEAALNIGIRHLPKDAEYIAWIDADVRFARHDWVTETIHQLQHHPMVQLFSEAQDLGPEALPINRYRSFGWSHVHHVPRKKDQPPQLKPKPTVHTTHTVHTEHPKHPEHPQHPVHPPHPPHPPHPHPHVPYLGAKEPHDKPHPEHPHHPHKPHHHEPYLGTMPQLDRHPIRHHIKHHTTHHHHHHGHYLGDVPIGYDPNIAYWHHPGFAWAARKETLDHLGGLIDWAIIGESDYLMATGCVGEVTRALYPGISQGYKDMCLEWQDRALKHLRYDIGYVPGLLIHSWHGRKTNRMYWDRCKILTDTQFDPHKHLKRDWQGLYQLVDRGDMASIVLRDRVREYFRLRNEDSIDL